MACIVTATRSPFKVPLQHRYDTNTKPICKPFKLKINHIVGYWHIFGRQNKAMSSRKEITQKERFAFSARLKASLAKAFKTEKATVLANKFNLTYCLGEPITTQTVTKWLNGKSFPTKDKMPILANLLGVNENWLRYGIGSRYLSTQFDATALQSGENLSPDSLLIARYYEGLSIKHRHLVEEMVQELSHQKKREEES